MKYLITLCLTAIAIAFLTNAARIQTTEVKAEAKMRIQMFRDYDAREHQRDAGPKVEVPTEKDLKREKL